MRTRQAERFFQLSSDLSTMRWSWKSYLLVDELVGVRCVLPQPAPVPQPGPLHTRPPTSTARPPPLVLLPGHSFDASKPLCFSVHYASVTGSSTLESALSLSFVCRKSQHAAHWVVALRLLHRAFSQTWGLPTEQVNCLKAAFRAAKGSGETLSLSQQQDFFACLNRQISKAELQQLHALASVPTDWHRCVDETGRTCVSQTSRTARGAVSATRVSAWYARLAFLGMFSAPCRARACRYFFHSKTREVVWDDPPTGGNVHAAVDAHGWGSCSVSPTDTTRERSGGLRHRKPWRSGRLAGGSLTSGGDGSAADVDTASGVSLTATVAMSSNVSHGSSVEEMASIEEQQDEGKAHMTAQPHEFEAGDETPAAEEGFVVMAPTLSPVPVAAMQSAGSGLTASSETGIAEMSSSAEPGEPQQPNGGGVMRWLQDRPARPALTRSNSSMSDMNEPQHRRGTWRYMLQLFMVGTQQPEVGGLFFRYANWGMGKTTDLTLEDWRSFWRKEQLGRPVWQRVAGEADEDTATESDSEVEGGAVQAEVSVMATRARKRWMEEATRLFEQAAPADGAALSLAGFQMLLLSPSNAVADPRRTDAKHATPVRAHLPTRYQIACECHTLSAIELPCTPPAHRQR